MKHPVFNYKTQQWEDNRALYLEQLNESLALLESDKGMEFAAYGRNWREVPDLTAEEYHQRCLANVRAMIKQA